MNLYLPFSYLLTTRIKTKHERISWVIIYPLFLLFVVILLSGDILNFIASFIMTMSLYEIGYLDNDFRTVKKEKDPTLRATEQRTWIENNIFSLVALRILISAILGVFLYVNTNITQQGILLFLIILLFLGFYYHNTIRSRWNVLTYFIVVFCRYMIPVIVSVNSVYYPYLVPFIIFSFPLVRTFEHACKEKYGFIKVKKLVRNPDLFRVKWYLVVTLFVFFAMLLLHQVKVLVGLFILSVYFLLYRIATLYISRTKQVMRNKHQSYNWDDNEK